MPPPSAVTASAAAPSFLRSVPPSHLSVHTTLPRSISLRRSTGSCHTTLPRSISLRRSTGSCSRQVARAAASGARGGDEAETVYFDGGAHYGDLVANLVLGLTLLWLPLTLAAVSRAFLLRYRFTSRRVTVISGLSGDDRTDFPYSSVSSVVVVPRFIGEWGDIVITLKDGTKVDLRSVPRFREVAEYCRSMAAAEGALGTR